MVPFLLVAFPFLLLVYPRVAWVVLAVAIWQIAGRRFAEARLNARRRTNVNADSDASI